MYAEDLALDDSCEREIVEGIIEIIPDIMVAVFLGDFVVEAVGEGDVARLVVAAQQNDHLGVLDFVEK